MAKRKKNEGKIKLMSQGRRISIIHRKISFKKPLIIAGFQGIGLVGTLSAQYIVSKLKLEQIGHINSEELPPLAVLVNGSLMHPIRIFTNKNKDLIIIESELPIPRKLVYRMSDEITSWAKKIKAKGIICFEGIAVPPGDKGGKLDVYSISTTKVLREKLDDHVSELKNGIVIGMSAAILLQSKDKKLNASCLMSESKVNVPDGMAASAIIKKFNQIYGYKINTSELEKQAKEFEKKLGRVLSHARQFSLMEAAKVMKEKPPVIYG